jgi:hypothetical protein
VDPLPPTLAFLVQAPEKLGIDLGFVLPNRCGYAALLFDDVSDGVPLNPEPTRNLPDLHPLLVQ